MTHGGGRRSTKMSRFIFLLILKQNFNPKNHEKRYDFFVKCRLSHHTGERGKGGYGTLTPNDTWRREGA